MNWSRLWPWRRRHDKKVARAAIVAAERRLAVERVREREVVSLVEQLREIREANNFAALLRASYRDRR